MRVKRLCFIEDMDKETEAAIIGDFVAVEAIEVEICTEIRG